jgi:hypothetical protein
MEGHLEQRKVAPLAQQKPVVANLTSQLTVVDNLAFQQMGYLLAENR